MAAAVAASSCPVCPVLPSPVPLGNGGSSAAVPASSLAARAASFTLDPATKILIVTEPDYGRFTNNKIGVMEALGLAMHTNRSLILPPFPKCDVGPKDLWNLGAIAHTTGVTVLQDRTNMDLSALCGGNGTLVWYSSIVGWEVKSPPEGARGTRVWRGVTWDVRESQTLPFDASTIPSELLPYTRSDYPHRDVHPYSTYFTDRVKRIDLPQFMTDGSFHARVAALPDRCVIVPVLYLNLNWAALPGLFEPVVASFQPSPELEMEVGAFFRNSGVPPFKAVAVHLRMGDIAAGFQHGFGHNCVVHGAGFVIDTLRGLQRAYGGADYPLLVASDDYESPCVVAIIAAFPRHVRVVGGARLAGFAETEFVQEVLARSSGYVGNGYR